MIRFFKDNKIALQGKNIDKHVISDKEYCNSSGIDNSKATAEGLVINQSKCDNNIAITNETNNTFAEK